MALHCRKVPLQQLHAHEKETPVEVYTICAGVAVVACLHLNFSTILYRWTYLPSGHVSSMWHQRHHHAGHCLARNERQLQQWHARAVGPKRGLLVLVALAASVVQVVEGAVGTPAVMVAAVQGAALSAPHKHHVVEGAS